MTWGAVAGAAVSVVGSYVASKAASKGGGGASTSSQLTPAYWAALGNADPGTPQAWYDMMGNLNTRHYTAPNYKPSPTGGGPAPYAGDDLRAFTSIDDIMQRKYSYQNQQYNDIYNDLMRNMGGATDTYASTVDRLSQPAFHIGLGDQIIGITPRRNAMLADMASSVLDARNNQYQADTNMRLAGMERFYPGAANMEWMNTVYPMLMEMQKLRFGLPSSTETGSLQPSMLQSIGQGLSLAQSATNLYNSWKPPATPTPTPALAPTNYSVPPSYEWGV